MEYRNLPSVDSLLASRKVVSLADTYPHDLLLKLAREQLEFERLSIAKGNSCRSADEIILSLCDRVNSLDKPDLRKVINATGVILHTNLGRAPLSREAIQAMDEVGKGYCNLEYDLDKGTRGSRHSHIEQILCLLTGAEAALVVNNNASAVLLGITALAKRKEVVISRGQAVEIGGGFRIPDVMRQSGARLVEVGTTNCTYVADFESAINQRTAVLMRIHSSNFKLVGFTSEVSLDEMVALGKRSGLLVFDDLGSGCFLDTASFGLAPEPTVQHSVALGAGLTFFSGDKLVGGPQAGIIVGEKLLINRLKKHPLARAVRIDKVRLAGLIATLVHYLRGEASTKIPVWRMISMPVAEIDRRAQRWAQALGNKARIIPGETMIGGGSLPGGTLPTRLIAIGAEGKRKQRNIAHEISRVMSHHEVPVIGRINDDVLLLDPRTVLPEEDDIIIKSLKEIAVSIKA